MPDDESSRIGTEPDYGRGDFLWLAHPSDWLLRDHFRAPLWRASGEAIHHRSVDVTGTNGVDADVRCRIVEGRRFVGPINACFPAGYGGLPLIPNIPSPEEVLN